MFKVFTKIFSVVNTSSPISIKFFGEKKTTEIKHYAINLPETYKMLQNSTLIHIIMTKLNTNKHNDEINGNKFYSLHSLLFVYFEFPSNRI